MRRYILFILPIMLCPALIRADVFDVGGETVVVPDPNGFVRVNKNMVMLRRYLKQVAAADTSNDTLAVYIRESIVPAAMEGRIPELKRWCIVKVPNSLRNTTINTNIFAEYKKVVKQHYKRVLEKLGPQMREASAKMSEGVSGEFDLDISIDSGQVVPLAVHHDSENSIAHSMFMESKVTVGKQESSEVISATTESVNVSGRLLNLYVYGEKEDLKWTRTASRDWATRTLQRNDPPSSGSGIGTTIDWCKVAEKGMTGGMAGGLMAGLLALLGILRRYRKRYRKD